MASDSDHEFRQNSHKKRKAARQLNDTDSEEDSPVEAQLKRKARVESESGDSGSSGDDRSESEGSESEYEEGDGAEGEGGEEEEPGSGDAEGQESGDDESGSSSEWETGEEDNAEEVTPSTSGAKPVTTGTAGDQDCFSDSSDGQSDKCPICLSRFNGQEIGSPESCDHSFCLVCIQEWSKNINTCPVDRLEFYLIFVRKKIEGKIVNRIPVEKGLPAEEVVADEDPTYCEVCGLSDREDRLLLCDGCDLGYHMECLEPPLDAVPLEEWYCQDCSQNNTILAEEVDFEQDELFDLLEDAPPVDLPPRRARQHAVRLVPRTRQYERVRRQIRTRQRDARNDEAELPEHATADNAGTGVGRRTTKAGPRKRKTTTRRKGYRRKRKTATRRKRKTKTTTTIIKKEDGTSVTVVKKRKVRRRRRKVRRKKGLARRRRTVRPVAVPQSVRGRLAGQLGMLPLKNGQSIPMVKSVGGKPNLDFQRSSAGIPTLRLFGTRHELDHVCSESDDSGSELTIRRPARPRIGRPRDLARVKAMSILSRFPQSPLTASPPGRSPTRPRESAASERSSQTTFDVLGGILEKQSKFLQAKSKDTTISRDGSILSKKQSSVNHSAPASPSVSKSVAVSATNTKSPEKGDASRNPLNSSGRRSAPSLNNTGSNVSSRPLNPAGGASGGNHGRGDDQTSSGDGTHRINDGGGFGHSHSTPYDPHGSRAYSDFLSSGSGGMSGNFGEYQSDYGPPGSRTQHGGDYVDDDDTAATRKSSKSSDKGSSKGRTETEEEDIDIYSDIEPGSEAMDFETCNDVPLPHPLGDIDGDDMEHSRPELDDDREHSDSELIIDDNAHHEGAHARDSDKYDPAEPSTDPYSPNDNLDLSNVSQSSVPESEKYDPADPSYDSDDNELRGSNSFADLSIALADKFPNIESPPSPPAMINTEKEREDTEREVEKIIAKTSEDRFTFFRNIPLPPSPGSNSLAVRSGYSSVNDYSESRTSTPTNDEDYDRIGAQGRQPVQYSDSGNIVEYSDSDSETTSGIMKTSTVPAVQLENIPIPALPDTSDRSEQKSRAEEALLSDGKDDSFETKSGATSEKEFETDLASDQGKAGSATEKGKRPSILEEIFGTDSESEVSSKSKPKHQAQSSLGLENLETETISETEETNFDDLDEGGENIEEGEIPVKNKYKKKQQKQLVQNSDGGNVRVIPSVLSLHRSVHLRLGRGPFHGEGDYEEGEIVDDKPKPKREKKKESRKRERETRVTDENFNALHFSEDNTKKKRRSSGGATVASITAERFSERPVLASSENKKQTVSSSRKGALASTVSSSNAKGAGSSNISWKKLSKSSRDRNYRDGKPKDSDTYFNKERESKRKRDASGGDSSRSRERKKKEKRKDLERYDVRKVVSERSRREAEKKRKDEFGRDVSRGRTYSRSRSHERSRRSREGRHGKSHSREKEHTRSHSRDYGTGRHRSYSRSHSWTPSWDSRSYSRSPTPVHSKHRHSYSYSPESHSSYYKDKHNQSSWSEKKRSSHKEKQKETSTTKKTKPVKEVATVPKKKEKKEKKREKKVEIPVSSRKKEEVKEKKRKKKEKSPAPSKEVFASGDNILVSVNFNKTKPANVSNSSSVAGLSNKEGVQKGERRKRDTSESDREGRKRKKEDKAKDRSPKRKRLEPSFEQSKKVVLQPPPQMSTPVTQMKPVPKRRQVIIDLEMSPIQELTPSPEAVIVLSDSESDRPARDVDSRIPKTPPPLSMSTGPKTPPEPQVKFSITSKPQLRTITNPLCEDEEELEEVDDDGEDQSQTDILTSVPPAVAAAQPRGPSTPTCERPATPVSPGTPEADAYDPFEPTKSPSQSPQKSPEPPRSPLHTLNGTVEVTSVAPSVKDERPALPPEPEKPPLPVEPEPPEKSPASNSTSVGIQDDKPPVSENSQILSVSQQQLNSSGTQHSKSSSPPVTSAQNQIAVTLAFTSAQTAVVSTQATIPPVVSTVGARGSLFTSLPPNVANVLCNPLAQGIFTTLPGQTEQVPAQLATSLLGSPLVSAVVPTSAVSSDKHVSSRTIVTHNGESRVQPDTTDVVDMDLESPYSPASSEGDDLFEPPDKPPSPDYSPLDAAIEQRMAAIVKGGAAMGKVRTPLKPQQSKSSHPAGTAADKFENLFGVSASANRKTGKVTQNQNARSNKGHKSAGGKWKGSGSQKQHVKVQGGKAGTGKKEIGVRMDEDQLKIMDDLPSSAVEMQVKEKYLKKLNRQERVVEEVKLSLKPHYTKKHISKEEYKDILRKSVPKICHNRSGEINPIKIQHLVEAYVKKVRHQRKREKPQNAVKGKA